MVGTPQPLNRQTHMTENITFATPLAGGNEYFPHNCSWTSREKFGGGDVIAGVGTEAWVRS